MSQSLLKAIQLLDCFDENPELTLLELVEISKMPKTTVFRLVSSLVEAGLLVKVKYSSHDVRYKMGLKLLELGMRVNKQLEYREIALPYMKELNAKLNESVHLAVIEKDETVYVEKLDSTKPLRLIIKIGARIPLYKGSASKVLLANLKKTEQEEYLKKLKLNKLDEHTFDNIEQLVKELQEIREKGYSYSKEEIYKDIIGYSCPIFDNSGKILAAMGVSIPIIEFTEEKGEHILNEVLKTANIISKELGYK
ncbi:IclR family transcriptional regulator [Oceanobacillus saliphilus]|uniref:IclR family transcriptional regulator n=1 Tax=Oceanobacillus saliphilus TaxID=2925834 RepID=UPI00201D3ED7|nr:IclR family transcriptional regulator [Oceanobacillus saliphilus]